MSENAKDEIIEKAYKEFFGSIADTFKQAKKLDKSIKLEDVKKWLNQKFARKTKQLQNSYVAHYAYQEYHMDLFFMPESDGEEYNTGLLLIVIFTIFATVAPAKSKQADDILASIKKGSENMGKLPRCYTQMTKSHSILSKRSRITASPNKTPHNNDPRTIC